MALAPGPGPAPPPAPAAAWYAVYDLTTGSLTSTGTVIGDPAVLASRNLGFLALSSPPPADVDWNPASRTFSTPVVDAGGVTQVLNNYPTWEWVARFTPDELATIRASADRTVQELFFELMLTQTVQPAGQVVQQGLAYLASVGLLTAPRVAVIGAN